MADIRFGVANDIDFIAASFTRKASDVLEVRAFAEQAMREQGISGPAPHIIAKIGIFIYICLYSIRLFVLIFL